MLGWVAEDGSYGTGEVVTFNVSFLTDSQWEELSNLRDSERYNYVMSLVMKEYGV